MNTTNNYLSICIPTPAEFYAIEHVLTKHAFKRVYVNYPNIINYFLSHLAESYRNTGQSLVVPNGTPIYLNNLHYADTLDTLSGRLKFTSQFDQESVVLICQLFGDLLLELCNRLNYYYLSLISTYPDKPPMSPFSLKCESVTEQFIYLKETNPFDGNGLNGVMYDGLLDDVYEAAKWVTLDLNDFVNQEQNLFL